MFASFNPLLAVQLAANDDVVILAGAFKTGFAGLTLMVRTTGVAAL